MSYDPDPGRLRELLAAARPSASITTTAGLTDTEARTELEQLGYVRELAMTAVRRAWLDGAFLLRKHVVRASHASGEFTVAPWRSDGPDILTATVTGESILALRELALALGRQLYGEDAPLAITHISRVRGTARQPGRYSCFTAEVTVRCLQLPEGWETA